MLTSAGSGLAHGVRFNFYVTTPAATGVVERALAIRCVAAPVAVTFVQTPLADERALVAVDAVAAQSVNGANTGNVKGAVFAPGLSRPRVGAHAFVMPAGRKIFISGRAEKSADMQEGASKSLASLISILRHLDLEPSHAVQVKAYFSPNSARAAVRICRNRRRADNAMFALRYRSDPHSRLT